jgi:hypothetical protein
VKKLRKNCEKIALKKEKMQMMGILGISGIPG